MYFDNIIIFFLGLVKLTMPRSYLKKTTAKYSHGDLITAMEMVRNGDETIYSAAKSLQCAKRKPYADVLKMRIL